MTIKGTIAGRIPVSRMSGNGYEMVETHPFEIIVDLEVEGVGLPQVIELFVPAAGAVTKRIGDVMVSGPPSTFPAADPINGKSS